VVEIPGKVKIHTITAISLYKQADWMNHLGFVPQFWALLATKVTGRPVSAVNERVSHALGYNNEKTLNPTLRIDRILPIQSAGPLSSSSEGLSFVDPLWLKKTDKILARMKSCQDGEGFCIGLWRGLRPAELAAQARLNKMWKGSKRQSAWKASSVGTLWFTVSHWMNSPLMPLLQQWAVLFDLKPIKTIFKTAYTVEFGQIKPWGLDDHGSLESCDSGLGKLGFLEEPAGKIRVVAMVDILTQSILKPLHDWIFGVLRQIPEDGTFDQKAPLELLISKGCKDVYSYDLSAATDRLPLALQESLIGWLLGEKVARLWASLLVNRTYWFHANTARKYGLNTCSVRYGAGQPMGAYSSWAMLALTHHFCVQLAAWRVYGNTGAWFSLYAVLGDDVVIADNSVAMAYLSLMRDELRVEINDNKSMVSKDGTFEFAKRTIFRGEDATPISLKGFMAGLRNLPAMEGILANLPGVYDHRLPSVARALGFGYKAIGRLQGALQQRNRLQGLIVFLTRPGGLLGRDFLAWVSQDAWNCVGGSVTYDSLQDLYREVASWAGDKVRKALEHRSKLFGRGSKGGGFVPTLSFPTRVLLDVYQNLVLRPIHSDIMDRISQLDLLMVQFEKRTEISEDEFREFMKELDYILKEVEDIPKNPRVARLVKDKVISGSSTLKLWRKLRTFVKKD
jgi:hypothetical protein